MMLFRALGVHEIMEPVESQDLRGQVQTHSAACRMSQRKLSSFHLYYTVHPCRMGAGMNCVHHTPSSTHLITDKTDFCSTDYISDSLDTVYVLPEFHLLAETDSQLQTVTNNI